MFNGPVFPPSSTPVYVPIYPVNGVETLYPQLANYCAFRFYSTPTDVSATPILPPKRDSSCVFFGQLPRHLIRAQVIAILNLFHIHPDSVSNIQSTRSGTFCYASFNDPAQYQATLNLHRRILFDINGIWIDETGTNNARMHQANEEAVRLQTRYSLPHRLLVAEPSLNKNPQDYTTHHVATQNFTAMQNLHQNTSPYSPAAAAVSVSADSSPAPQQHALSNFARAFLERPVPISSQPQNILRKS